MRKIDIGDCTLYQGDCRAVLPGIEQIDTILTDPPYGIDLKPQRKLTESIAGDGKDEARALWEETLALTEPLLKPDTAHMFWTGWSETWTKDVLENYFHVKSCIVWAKNMWGIGYYTRPQHEFAWYCHRGKPPVPARPDSDLWQVQKVMAPRHSCEKPVPLMSRALRLLGGDVVLDPFMGIGTTGVACAKAGKRFIGVELDSGHFELACERIEEAYRQPDMLVEAPTRMEQTSLLLGDKDTS